ncbi:MAG: outer membrane beta-barrel domain-containing protein [Gammaproteobacteria bacterium]|jgi:outer membrane beta-barrel protein
MESRICIFLLKSVCVLTVAGLLQACSFLRVEESARDDTEPVIKPELDRRSITEADIDSEDFEIGVFAGVLSIEDFGSSPVYGARAAYHVTEDFFVEAALGRSDADETSYETLSGAAQILADDERELTYYNISLGYNLFPGEAFVGGKYAFNSSLYLIAGVGNTEFANDSHFTINAGAGYRLLLKDWLALHVDVRDHIFDSDLLGKDKTTHNIEAHGGFTVFF